MRRAVAGSRWLATLAALGVLASPASAGFTVPPNKPGDFAPRDECSSLPGVGALIAALREAVARRDARALAGLASDDVLLDYGGGAGRAELVKRLSGAEGGALWRELDQVLALGCARFEDGDIVLPWIFAQDLGDVDPYDAVLATGRDVPLFRKPGMKGKPFARLNWQLVVHQSGVKTPGGVMRVSAISSPIEGYAPAARLRSIIGYRLTASRKGDGWKVTAFIAGD